MHAFKYRVLVIACRTADSPELHKAMGTRCELGPAAFTLVVPRAGSGTATVQALVDRLREAGFEVDGFDADADPIVAFQEAWDPGRFDEVIVSTLPTEASRWLLPSDGLWRGTIYALEPSVVIAGIVGVGGPRAEANPFFAPTPPPTEFLIWSVVWIAAILALATWSLSRRDL